AALDDLQPLPGSVWHFGRQDARARTGDAGGRRQRGTARRDACDAIAADSPRRAHVPRRARRAPRVARQYRAPRILGGNRSVISAGQRGAAAGTVTAMVDPDDIEWSAIRAQGAGAQTVNKVSSAVHLRFDIAASRLPDAVKARLLAQGDQRISSDGVVVIKAQRYRSQDRNRDDALARLQQLVDAAAAVPV